MTFLELIRLGERGPLREAEDGGAGGGGEPPAADPPAPDGAPGTVLTGTPEGDEAPPASAPGQEGGGDADGPTDGEGEQEKPEGVPETADGYTFDLGEDVELDQGLIDLARPAFHEAGVTQAQAQRLAELMATYREAEAEARADGWNQTQRGWLAEAEADAEYAGDGWKNAVVIANRALDQFGTPELVKALADTGMGNHPELIRLAYRVGKTLADDTTTRGTGEGTDTAPMEQRLYGATTPASKRT